MTAVTIVLIVFVTTMLFVYGRAFLYSFSEKYEIDKRLTEISKNN